MWDVHTSAAALEGVGLITQELELEMVWVDWCGYYELHSGPLEE